MVVFLPFERVVQYVEGQQKLVKIPKCYLGEIVKVDNK